MACVDIPVAKAGIVTGATLKVAMAHTGLGDLTLKLYSPADARKALTSTASRPGVLEAADDGVEISGESANLEVVTPVTYRDGVRGQGRREEATRCCNRSARGLQDRQPVRLLHQPRQGPGREVHGLRGLGGWTLTSSCAGRDSVGTDTGSISASSS